MSSDVAAARVQRIRALLAVALEPLELEVEDQGHLHRGHAGAASGAGHFRVRIVSRAFSGRPRIARHRAVYEALSAEMGAEIHALALETLAPEECGV